ncbi:MAG: c-type cytochrome, partial [Myxococcales bacterium]|nr:c-type cytochrome [Myxococcales bacterium]
MHVYDGIQEADNDLPRWWLTIFYGTIAFALFYWFAYHGLGALPLPLEAYSAELEKQGGQGGEMTDAYLVTLSKDPNSLKQGEAVFAKNCVVCHEADARGKIGPNLTDAYWIHGGAPTDIWKTVKLGTPAGMPAWGGLLGPKDTPRVVAYVLSLRNTNVAGGKEPQGELWDPDAAGEAAKAPAAEGADSGVQPANPAASGGAAPSPAPTAE